MFFYMASVVARSSSWLAMTWASLPIFSQTLPFKKLQLMIWLFRASRWWVPILIILFVRFFVPSQLNSSPFARLYPARQAYPRASEFNSKTDINNAFRIIPYAPKITVYWEFVRRVLFTMTELCLWMYQTFNTFSTAVEWLPNANCTFLTFCISWVICFNLYVNEIAGPVRLCPLLIET